MDHNYPTGGRNLIRPESPLQVAQLSGSQPHQHHYQQEQAIQHQHIHHHQQQQQQHYQALPSSHQDHYHLHQSLGSEAVMAGVTMDGSSFHPESQMVMPSSIAGAMGLSMHSRYHEQPFPSTSSSERFVTVDASAPSSSKQAKGKTIGKKKPRKQTKICGVCGDHAKSFHFGGISCDSCKAFFRRSVHNQGYMSFRCAYDGCCDININTRKSCQFCRFEKCIGIGMEKSWVMSEEERTALNQQRLEKKQATVTTAQQQQEQQQHEEQQEQEESSPESVTTSVTMPVASSEPTYTTPMTTLPAPTPASTGKEPTVLAFQDSTYVADPENMLDYMTLDEQLEIKMIVESYLKAYKEMPFKVSWVEGTRDSMEIVDMFTTILRRFAYFAKLIPDFSCLQTKDQETLLKVAVLEMCLLRGAACFDMAHSRWPASTMETLKDCPRLRLEDMQRLVSRELFEMHITFIYHMQRLRIDEPIAMLLIMTVLFSPERACVTNKKQINDSQEKYLMLLKKYTNWRFGVPAGSRVYPQLLTKLSDLRQLNDYHTEFHLKLDPQQINAIKNGLKQLHLNPYHNWEIVPDSGDNSSENSQSPPHASITVPTMPTAPSLPMVTQALVQSFADRRIPALLENPYAQFETDLGMIRQFQQTLGSYFPSSGIASFTTANTRPHEPGQCNPSTESENSRGIPPINDPALGFENAVASQTSAFHGISTDSLDRSFTLPSSFADSLSSLLPAEYHTEKLHRFMQQIRSGGGDSGIIDERLLREIGASLGSTLPSSMTPQTSTPSIPISTGSQQHQSSPQTVLRKHSSKSSLPAVQSSVIRMASSSQISAPSATSTSSSMYTSSVIQQHRDQDPTEGNRRPDGSDEIAFRPITGATGTSSGGWHGGEVHTTADELNPQILGVVTGTVKRPPTFYGSDEEEPNFHQTQ